MLWANTLLLLIAFIAAVTAIGGDTWRNTDGPWTKRVTGRGRVSIACFILALVVGVFKEYRSAQESGRQLKVVETLNDKNDVLIDTTRTLVKETKAQREEIDKLNSALQEATVALAETKDKLTKQQVAAEKTGAEIKALVYEKLSLYTTRFLSTIATMIEDASGGWLPKNEAEFFSRKSVDLICRELNGDGAARVTPARSWFDWYSQQAEEYRNGLGELLRSYASQLDQETIKSISLAERTTLLWMLPQWARARRTIKQQSWQYPPLFCLGVEDHIEKSLLEVSDLYHEIKKGEIRFNLTKRPLPLPKESNALGQRRFGPADLIKWQKDHPDAPSGKPASNP